VAAADEVAGVAVAVGVDRPAAGVAVAADDDAVTVVVDAVLVEVTAAVAPARSTMDMPVNVPTVAVPNTTAASRSRR
jgi:hypothetical protein